jgi:RNA polymerase sigma factor (sigma-70 family)
MTEYSDIELLQLFRETKTSEQAFNLIVRKYQNQVYWNVRRMVIDHDDADDITQNVFIKIWRSLDNFREDARLSTWIYRIGVNETITFINRKKMKAMLRFSDYEEQLTNSLHESDYFSADKTEQIFQKALITLPAKQRLIFNMRYYDELTYENISDILGTSVGALKASYHHAVKKIENFISSH